MPRKSTQKEKSVLEKPSALLGMFSLSRVLAIFAAGLVGLVVFLDLPPYTSIIALSIVSLCLSGAVLSTRSNQPAPATPQTMRLTITSDDLKTALGQAFVKAFEVAGKTFANSDAFVDALAAELRGIEIEITVNQVNPTSEEE